jgi:hypothetical protein
MPETQQIDFKLALAVKKRRKWYLAVCPILDLAAQGPTPERAVASLWHAVVVSLAIALSAASLMKL